MENKHPLKFEICAPYLKVLPKPILRRSVNTFTPTPYNMFQVLHYLDSLTQFNSSFQEKSLPWHPLVSRIYYGTLFMLQTYRCMREAGILPLSSSVAMDALFKVLSPDSLTIAGPLMPIFRDLTISTPANPSYNIVTPAITTTGFDNLDNFCKVIDARRMAVPNIPTLLHLTSLLTASEDIPDLTDQDYFTNRENNVLFTHTFSEDGWNASDRLFMLTPGMIHPPETDSNIDDLFNSRGGDALVLPSPKMHDDISGLFGILYLNQQPYWFNLVAELMAEYNDQFESSSTLGSIALNGSSAGLITCEMNTLSSDDMAQNIVNTCDRMFPGEFPMKYIYSYRTNEKSIPLLQQSQSKFAALNTEFTVAGIPIWSSLNLEGDAARTGPYWAQSPPKMGLENDQSFLEVEEIIRSQYLKH